MQYSSQSKPYKMNPYNKVTQRKDPRSQHLRRTPRYSTGKGTASIGGGTAAGASS